MKFSSKIHVLNLKCTNGGIAFVNMQDYHYANIFNIYRTCLIPSLLDFIKWCWWYFIPCFTNDYACFYGHHRKSFVVSVRTRISFVQWKSLQIFWPKNLKLNKWVHTIWIIWYESYDVEFKTVEGIKNLVSDIDEPVDYSNVGIRFMKNSYDLSRKVTTFLSE